MADLPSPRQLQALLAHQEKQAKRDRFAPPRALFPQQLAYFNDPAPRRMVLTTRRGGKTTLAIFELLWFCETNPGAICAYFAFSRAKAKENIWDDAISIKRMALAFGLDVTFNEVDLEVRFANGSKISLEGVADQGEVERVRGQAYDLIVVDEMQSWPAYVASFLATISATTAKAGKEGRITLLGTCSVLPVGYWHDLWNKDSLGYSGHEWTLHDNPTLFDGDKVRLAEWLATEAKSMGGVDSAAYRREYGKEWVRDTVRAVWAGYDAEANDYDRLPGGERYTVVCFDLGMSPDKTATVTTAFYPTAPHELYILDGDDEFEFHPTNIGEIAIEIQKQQQKHAPASTVIDEGALGKLIANSFRTMPPYLNVEAIDKAPNYKNAAIATANMDLASRRIRIKKGSKLAADLVLMTWDEGARLKGKLEVSSHFHSDLADAFLGGVRKMQEIFHTRPEIQPPREKTPDELASEHKRSLEQAWQEGRDEAAWSGIPW